MGARKGVFGINLVICDISLMQLLKVLLLVKRSLFSLQYSLVYSALKLGKKYITD